MIIWLKIQIRWKCIDQKKYHLNNIYISIEFMVYKVTTKNVCWIHLVFNRKFAFLSCCEKGHHQFYTLSPLWLYIKILWGSWKYVDNRKTCNIYPFKKQLHKDKKITLIWRFLEDSMLMSWTKRSQCKQMIHSLLAYPCNILLNNSE